MDSDECHRFELDELFHTWSLFIERVPTSRARFVFSKSSTYSSYVQNRRTNAIVVLILLKSGFLVLFSLFLAHHYFSYRLGTY